MCHLLDGTSVDRKQGQREKKEQCSLRPATEERQLMGQNCYKCGERGHIARECFLNEEKQDQMHPTIKEEVVAEEEDTNDEENIFVQKN